ncbi:interferon-induced GTP-binding protein Mx3-like [Corticium candelabrum]|uniref:interferon-induced GTP-binding protein Mx3-like n=1 Tax=Corticium candelabrum TaxID=121492 RepID=UPI002E2556CB|nr:interferon-induced GTP-binding protein Mx3-like [Corticium candelabrum]
MERHKLSRLTFAEAYDKSVRPYIDLVDSLRSSGVDKDVSLPSVVVIGDQSTGKSSVLEAISGVQLPRGTGIVTRCALELRLKKNRRQNASDQWSGRLRYVTKSGKENVELTSPEEVESAVQRAQNALAGDGKGVSEDGKIELEVCSPHVPDLTLIDLPGITRVAIEGQPHNIADMIKSLIKKHITKGETIILCVIPCTSDITTSEALVFSREVDPEGDRTLGVLTRADQTGQGEEKAIMDILQQRSDVKLKLGCTVVKCRSQKDIENQMSLDDALEAEREFFQEHEMFCKLEADKMGIKELSLKLTRQLVEHIQACLPNLLVDVEKALTQTKANLDRLGSPLPKNKIEFLVEALLQYGKTLGAVVKGDCIAQKELNDDRIFKDVRSCFHEFGKKIHSLCPDEGRLEDIEEQIKEKRGRELPGFENYGVFEAVAFGCVNTFKEPALECLQNVKQLIEKAYVELAAGQFERFPTLKRNVIGQVGSLFQKRCNAAEEAIETMMSMEEWIYTRDSVYQNVMTDVSSEGAAGDRQPSPSVEPTTTSNTRFLGGEVGNPVTDESIEWSAKQLLQKLKGYFRIVSLRLGDHIPMAIMLHLLTNFVKDVETRLISKLVGFDGKRQKTSNDEDISSNESDSDKEEDALTIDMLVCEDANVALKRKTLKQKKQRLLDAQKELKTFTIKRKKEHVQN